MRTARGRGGAQVRDVVAAAVLAAWKHDKDHPPPVAQALDRLRT